MRLLIGIIVFCLSAGAWAGGLEMQPRQSERAKDAHPGRTYLLHLPGIAGARGVDRMMVGGLREGGFAGEIEIYDWTEKDPGLNALMAYQRNQIEAQKISEKITDRFRADPALHIILTSHSGGTGLAIWALEKLPPEVKVDEVLLLASALSPQYDLSKALTHVRGKCYSFCSENDVLVLGAGTTLFGTIDGVKTDSAGEYGFTLPPTADFEQYQKLIQKPYDKAWMEFGNIGDHIGPMRHAFAVHVLAPLIIGQATAVTAKAENAHAQGGASQAPRGKS